MADTTREKNFAQGIAEKAVFEKFFNLFGKNLAIFYMCIRYDVPFEEAVIPVGDVGNAWSVYKDKLHDKMAYRGQNYGGKGFFDAQVDITRIYGVDMTPEEFYKSVGIDTASRTFKYGTPSQRRAWGTGGKQSPYTNEDYAELDRLYAAFSSRTKGQSVDTQQEYILRDCARMELQKQKYIQAKDIGSAQKLNAMIQTNLASENLRKKDEKPLDDLRFDGIADAIERKFGIDPNQILTKEQAVEICCKWFMSHRYPYTLDCAHKMTLAIINATRINNEEPPLLDLPEELDFTDDFGEFAKKPNEAEKDAYEYLGLVRDPPKIPPKKKDGDPDGKS